MLISLNFVPISIVNVVVIGGRLANTSSGFNFFLNLAIAKKTHCTEFQSSGTAIPYDLYSFIVSPVQQVMWSPKQINTKQVETDEQEEHLVFRSLLISVFVSLMLFCGLQHCGHLKRKVPQFQSELQMLFLSC